MSRQIRSCDALAELIHECGFVPLFRNSIRGVSVEEPTPSELWFSDTVEDPWEWKGPVIRASGCAYGKFFPEQGRIHQQGMVSGLCQLPAGRL